MHNSYTSGISAASTDMISLITLAGIVVSIILTVLIRIGRGTLVPNVGVKTGPPIGSISNDLCPTVRKLHSVLSANGLTVARFSPAEIVSGSLILYGIAKLVGFGLKRK